MKNLFKLEHLLLQSERSRRLWFEFNQEYAMMLVAQLKERMFKVEKEVQQVFQT